MVLQGVQDALNSPEAEVSPQEAEAYITLEQEDNDGGNWGNDILEGVAPSHSPLASAPGNPPMDLSGIIEELSVEVAEGTDRCYRR